METLNRLVLEGRLENLPPEEKTDVAVFLSSTFTGACLSICIIEFDISATRENIRLVPQFVVLYFILYRVLHAI